MAAGSSLFAVGADSALIYTGCYSQSIDADTGSDANCALNDAYACATLQMGIAQFVSNDRAINALFSSTQVSTVLVLNSQSVVNNGVYNINVPLTIASNMFMIRGYSVRYRDGRDYVAQRFVCACV